MNLEELYAGLKLIAPAAYRVFKKKQSAPYIIYYIETNDRDASDDGSVATYDKSLVIELYTGQKDIDLERRVEALLAPYSFTCYEQWIESEQKLMNAYAVEITEK